MRTSLILGLVLAALTTSATFAVDGSSRTVDRLHQDTPNVGLHITDNDSEQTTDRLHKGITKAEVYLINNGGEQIIDHLHHSMSRLGLRTAQPPVTP